MKKLFLLTIFTCTTAAFVGCDDGFKFYSSKVTVLNDSKKLMDQTEQAFNANSEHACKALTGSGDTIPVMVPDSIYLSCKMPYTANMNKTDLIRYGYITKIIN